MTADGAAPETPVLVGVLERIVFHNEENQFCIGELRPHKERETCFIKGILPGVQCGETLELHGQWEQHREYGRQFHAKSFRSRLPSNVYGIRKYLGGGLVPGIGKAYAAKIVDHFGVDTLRVLEEDSGRLREVEGIGPKRAREIKAAWDAQRSKREVMLFLQTYGVSPAVCRRILGQYGTGAESLLRENPYEIARTIEGIGFRTADRIALNLGFASKAPERLEAGLVFALRALEDAGHTAFPKETVLDEAARLLDVDNEALEGRLPRLIETSVVRETAPGIFQLPGTDRAEGVIVAELRRLLAAPSGLPPIRIEPALAWAQARTGFAFAPEQTHALREALRHKVSILTGGPGTGKTTILRSLTAILAAKQARLVLASPTGRAAQRLAASCGRPAGTLHRLLQFDPATGGFVHSAQKPLSGDCFIVDEASMLDTRMAAAFFQAIPSRAHLVIVGDADQLPSVGPGNVLRDLISGKWFPVTALTRIFRQDEDSSIVAVAHRILGGHATPPVVARTPTELDPSRDIQMLAAPEPAACAEAVVSLCRDWIPRYWGREKEVQVLAPMHKGAAGIQNLNRLLQVALNPAPGAAPVPEGGRLPFRAGDRVIQTRNNYEKGVFNGDLGRVEEVNHAGVVTVAFDEHRVVYDRDGLGELTHAFAITVHKAQGSEFPIVVLPLVRGHFLLLQRNLLYTGITRAREKVLLVGDPAAWSMAVRNIGDMARLTGLSAKLSGGPTGIPTVS